MSTYAGQWWYMPLVPALGGTEAGESLNSRSSTWSTYYFQRLPGLHP